MNEYLTGEEMLPPDQGGMIEQAKLTYSPLGKAFEKKTKTIKDQEEKQVEALKVLKPVEHQQKLESIEGIFAIDLKNSGVKNELNEVVKFGKQNNRIDLL